MNEDGGKAHACEPPNCADAQGLARKSPPRFRNDGQDAKTETPKDFKPADASDTDGGKTPVSHMECRRLLTRDALDLNGQRTNEMARSSVNCGGATAKSGFLQEAEGAEDETPKEFQASRCLCRG